MYDVHMKDQNWFQRKSHTHTIGAKNNNKIRKYHVTLLQPGLKCVCVHERMCVCACVSTGYICVCVFVCMLQNASMCASIGEFGSIGPASKASRRVTQYLLFYRKMLTEL